MLGILEEACHWDGDDTSIPIWCLLIVDELFIEAVGHVVNIKYKILIECIFFNSDQEYSVSKPMKWSFSAPEASCQRIIISP